MKKVYCDICGKFIFEVVEGSSYVLGNTKGDLDLCADCNEKMKKAIKEVKERVRKEIEENAN